MEMYSNDSRGDAALRDSSARLKANARVSRAWKLMRMSIDVFLWTLGAPVSASDVQTLGHLVREE